VSPDKEVRNSLFEMMGAAWRVCLNIGFFCPDIGLFCLNIGLCSLNKGLFGVNIGVVSCIYRALLCGYRDLSSDKGAPLKSLLKIMGAGRRLCLNIGLFCLNIGPFCLNVGLFCLKIGLFCLYIEVVVFIWGSVSEYADFD